MGILFLSVKDSTITEFLFYDMILCFDLPETLIIPSIFIINLLFSKFTFFNRMVVRYVI